VTSSKEITENFVRSTYFLQQCQPARCCRSSCWHSYRNWTPSTYPPPQWNSFVSYDFDGAHASRGLGTLSQLEALKDTRRCLIFTLQDLLSWDLFIYTSLPVRMLDDNCKSFCGMKNRNTAWKPPHSTLLPYRKQLYPLQKFLIQETLSFNKLRPL